MPLLDLPPELLNHTISYLRFPETYHLRATSRLFASIVPAQPLPHWDVLVAAEDGTWARKRNRLACVYCARLLPAKRFTDREKSRRNKSWRACAACHRELMEELNGWALMERVTCAHTAFSTARSVVVDGLQRKGVCTCCDNAFERWGGEGVERGLCRSCAVERRESWGWGFVAVGAIWRDLLRGGKKRERWGDEDIEWELEDACLERVQQAYGYGYCACCLDDEPFEGWREGWRGVNVIKMER